MCSSAFSQTRTLTNMLVKLCLCIVCEIRHPWPASTFTCASFQSLKDVADIRSAEVELRNELEHACALKRLPFTTPQDRALVFHELEVLFLARGKPGVVQGLAAFEERAPNAAQVYLWIVMK